MIKKLTIILILIIFSNNYTFAKMKSTRIEYNHIPYAFSSNDEAKFRNNANVYMLLYEKAQPGIDKANYLQEAMKNYFLLEKINCNSVEAHVGLGRIYDEMKLDKFAQKHFYKAINIDKDNADANYYFGNFFFKRKDYILATKYYQTAYKYEYSRNYELNYKLGTAYEKLADIESAKKYYIIAQNIYSKNTQLNDKIRLLDELNYGGTQYYLFVNQKRNKQGINER